MNKSANNKTKRDTKDFWIESIPLKITKKVLTNELGEIRMSLSSQISEISERLSESRIN
jgi:hypothetical protein